jgi:hypothetical protein
MSLTYAQLIDGSVVSISFGAGTQAAPSLYYTVDTTTGIFFPGTGTLALTTSGTERLRVDSSGRLLVGTSTARTNLYGASANPAIQVEAAGFSGSNRSIVSICNNSTIGSGPTFALIASGDNAVGAVTVVNTGHQLGVVDFLGTDGTKPISAASIMSYVDGTPGANDMPGRLVFSTTADGAASPTERMRIDSSGRLLVGTSIARSNFFGTTLSSVAQIEGTGGATGRGALSVINNDVSNNPPYLLLGRSGAASLGSNAVVVSGSRLGTLTFHGADGTSFIEAATVAGEVDGTPGTNDMPGRLVFSTTADGAASPTERMRIDSVGNVGIGLAGSAATAYLHLAAGGTAASTSALKLTSGSLLTTAEVGATEFDGSSLYFTTNTTSTGRGQVVARQIRRLAANGSAIGPTIADYFGATSSINLPAAGVFEIEYFLYFTKTTAGTVTFTLTASSAPTGIFGTFIGAPATGVGSGAPQSGYTGAQAAATAAFPATASLTTAVNHTYTIRAQVITNAATTFKVQVTSSLGSVTPLAGSFYAVRQVAASTGNFT